MCCTARSARCPTTATQNAWIHLVPDTARGNDNVQRVHLVGNRVTSSFLAELGGLVDELVVIESAAPTTSGTIAAIRAAVVDQHATRIVVVGGDGMVHAAVNALAPLAAHGHDVSLGVIPLGSGNDFARGLDISLDDLPAACAVAVGPAHAIDLLHTAYGYVATVATCGFPARVNALANSSRWPSGPSRYTAATLRLVPRLRTDELTLTIDDADADTAEFTIVAVANTGWFGGGMHVAPDAQPTDGLATLVRVGYLGRLRLLRYLPSIFSGGHVKHRSTTLMSVRSVAIDGPATVELWGDGEPLGPLPVEITVVPNALMVASGR
jgi:diacylglycerol kinase (ATP)